MQEYVEFNGGTNLCQWLGKDWSTQKKLLKFIFVSSETIYSFIMIQFVSNDLRRMCQQGKKLLPM